MATDPLLDIASSGFRFAEEPVKKIRKPRVKKADRPDLTPEEVANSLGNFEVEVEIDTTPIVWDGVLGEPPMDWMRHNTWNIIQSLDELKAWWAQVQLDTENHVPCAADLSVSNPRLYPKIGFDLETTGLDNRLVLGFSKTHVVGVCLSTYASPSRSYGSGRASKTSPATPIKVCQGLYIPVAHKRWSNNLDMKEVLVVLQDIFDNAIVVTHNGKFDFMALQAETDLVHHSVQHHNYTEQVCTRAPMRFPEYPFLEDTQALMFLIDCNRSTRGGMGLKALSATFLNQTMIEFEEVTGTGVKKKGSRKQILKTFDEVPPHECVYYAAADAICTLQLSDIFGYIRPYVPDIHKIDHFTIGVQQWLEAQRVLIDREFLLDEDKFLDLKCEHTLKQIQKIVGFEINPDSTKTLGETLFEKMNLPNKGRTDPTKLYPRGNWKTDAASMESLAVEHPELTIFKLIVSYRELRSGSPKKLYDGSDPLDNSAKFSYSAIRTPTGRFACQGGDYEKDGGAGLNVQAIQALYGTKYVTVKALDTLSLQGVDGLSSGSMFDPALFTWLTDHVRPVEVVEYPSKDEIGKHVRASNPDLDQDATKALISTEILNQLQSHKNLGLVTLKEGISSYSLQDNPTVINNHLKLTPDSWVCILNECPDCFADPTITCPTSEIQFDTAEVMNLRRAFIAPPGWTFFSIDYAAIELRLVTNLAMEQLWIDGFVGGKDLHASMAAALYKDKFANADAAERSNLRSMAKSITFGNLYGGTARTIQQHLSEPITIEEAQELYKNWIGAIPGYKAWVDHQKVYVRKNQRVSTAFGRLRPLEQEFMANDYAKISYAERTALNHPAQGSAADILRVALYRIKSWIQANGLGDYVKMHFHVHDEIDLSCKDEWIPFIIPNLVRLLKVPDLIQLLKWPVPLDCDVEYGPSWDVKHKFKDHKWSGVPGLAGLKQAGFAQLYQAIVDGTHFTVEDYRSSILPVVYAHWVKTAYEDPYRKTCEETYVLTQKMIQWKNEHPTVSPLKENLKISYANSN